MYGTDTYDDPIVGKTSERFAIEWDTYRFTRYEDTTNVTWVDDRTGEELFIWLYCGGQIEHKKGYLWCREEVLPGGSLRDEIDHFHRNASVGTSAKFRQPTVKVNLTFIYDGEAILVRGAYGEVAALIVNGRYRYSSPSFNELPIREMVRQFARSIAHGEVVLN